MAANTVSLRIEGDSSDLSAAFERAGASSKEMAADINASSSKARAGFSELDSGVSASEGKFRGLADGINGTGDVMEGFRTGNVALMAMGFADLAGSLSSLVIPAVKSLATVLKTQLTTAMTFVSAHPLVAAILIGGAIIAGLILLETKFGLVSKAVRAVGDALQATWDFIRPILKAMAKALDDMLGPLDEVIGGVAKIGTKIGGSVIKGIGGLFHTGGVVPGHAGQDVPMILQAGETVVPRGKSAAGGSTIVINVSGVGMGRDFGDAVARALRDNKLIGVTV